MASAQRDPKTSVALERLCGEGVPRTSFFTAVRLLERLVPGVRVGAEGPFSREVLRFRHHPSMFSQPNELFSIDRSRAPQLAADSDSASAGWCYEITTCFLGLTGTGSPLPLFLVSELALDDSEATLQRAFLDLFHNRLTALFYRAVNRYSFASEFRSDASDAVSRRALQLAGFDVEIGASSLLGRLQKLHVSALFASGPATPRSLQNALRALLRTELDDVDLLVRELTGGWVDLDQSQRNSLGARNNETAVTFVIGSRVRHPGHEARVVIGPMTPAAARRFSPGGSGYEQVGTFVAALCSAPAVLKLELHVRRQAFPPFVLGARRIARDACIAARRDDDGSVAISVFDLPTEKIRE